MSRTPTNSSDEDRWWERAKCKGLPPSLFVPDDRGGTMAATLAICWGTHDGKICPVRVECERAGEELNEHGVWGGYMRSSKVVLRSKRQPYEEIADARPKRA